jgi:hypothetical protein
MFYLILKVMSEPGKKSPGSATLVKSNICKNLSLGLVYCKKEYENTIVEIVHRFLIGMFFASNSAA